MGWSVLSKALTLAYVVLLLRCWTVAHVSPALYAAFAALFAGMVYADYRADKAKRTRPPHHD
jgi:Na+/H+ antiporter NhaD/arsenite permease-like protein